MNFLDISMSKSLSWFATVAKCSEYLGNAVKEHDIFQIHVANPLIKLAPKCINGFAPNSDIEDTFVHSYIGQQKLKYTRQKLNMELANGTLWCDKKYNPDYVAYIKSVDINYDVVVGEFKAPNINSQVESDLLKLGKEMVIMYNKPVKKGIREPHVCSILAHGMFKSLEEFTLILQVISYHSSKEPRSHIKIQTVMIRRTQPPPLSSSPSINSLISYHTTTLEKDRKESVQQMKNQQHMQITSHKKNNQGFQQQQKKSSNYYSLLSAALTFQWAPKCINGFVPNPNIEDTFVHSYIGPLLESVFESEPLFRVNWANGTLLRDQKYIDDYIVYINHNVFTLITMW
ncbi:hypothetical protein INT45_008902 [Circinella minor]|uniref:Uncharacterized protein n=1 Tax=Circinella minor TaxID=1195481 RepID=A0A8H7S091_9FUNG|nr:hypothetical protein INT45_008902 [Circinella minor]